MSPSENIWTCAGTKELKWSGFDLKVNRVNWKWELISRRNLHEVNTTIVLLAVRSHCTCSLVVRHDSDYVHKHQIQKWRSNAQTNLGSIMKRSQSSSYQNVSLNCTQTSEPISKQKHWLDATISYREQVNLSLSHSIFSLVSCRKRWTAHDKHTRFIESSCIFYDSFSCLFSWALSSDRN